MEDRSVEERRQILRAILSRREFVAAGIVGALGMAGCSSGSDNGVTTPTPVTPITPSTPSASIPAGLQAVTGTVALPAGSTLSLSTLSVDVLTQTAAVSATGGFSLGISSGGPALALLLDAAGEGVLMSMLYPSRASQTISARSTAVSMLFYATSAYTFPAASMAKVLDILDADPAVTVLEAAVSQAIATDPHALANNAAPLQPAIKKALKAILGSPAATRSSKPAAPVLADVAPPTLMLLTPSEEQDGVTVNQDATTTSLLVSNLKRRPCRVYVYETRTLTNGVTKDISPSPLVRGPFDLDATEKVSLFNSLKDFTTFYGGTSPWQPVNLPAIPLELATGTDRTTYQVIVLTSSWKVLAGDALEPSFFRDSHFSTEIGSWRIDAKNLFYTSIFGDVLYPIFCLFGGLGPIVVSRAVLAGVVKAAAAAKATTFVRVISQLENWSLGYFISEGLAIEVREALASDISLAFYRDEVRQIIGQAEGRALQAESLALTGTRFSRASKMFLRVFEPIFKVGLLADGVDLLALIHDVYESDIGASWNALLIRQLLNLRPVNPRIAAGERVSFQVSNPTNATGTFEYDWTSSSLFAVLSAAADGKVGKSITTSSLNVDLVTTGSDTKPIDIVVIGYNTTGGGRVEIGRAGTTVSFTVPAQILPSNAFISVNEQRLFSVVVDGPPLPNGVTYKWTLTGTSGSIGAAPVVTTTVPQINYIANAKTSGADSLHVDVLDSAGVLLAKATAQVRVIGPSSIQFDIAGTWDPAAQPKNGHYSFSDFSGDRAPDQDPGLDILFFIHDLFPDPEPNDPTAQTPGVIIGMVVNAGEPIREGRIFNKVRTGIRPTSGDFQLFLSPDLNDPVNTGQRGPVGTGKLTLDFLGQLANGTYVTAYSFHVENDSGGTIIGTGVGRWNCPGSALGTCVI